MKYEVLKEFISNKSCRHLRKGEIYEASTTGKNVEALIKGGFIKELKEVELSGQHVGEQGDHYSINITGVGVFPHKLSPMTTTELVKQAASVGLSFKDEEEARIFIKKMKAYQVIRKDAKGFEPDWENENQHKYVGGFGCRGLDYQNMFSWRDLGQIYFKTEEDIRNSQKLHREEWLTLLGDE